MTTIVNVTGQIMGNSKLAHRIANTRSQLRSTSFNGYQITFSTKKEAKKALWEAFVTLRKDEPDFARGGGIRYHKGRGISYDASIAEIAE